MKQILLIICLAFSVPVFAEYPVINIKHLPLDAPASEVAQYNDYILSHYPGYSLRAAQTLSRCPYLTTYFYTNSNNDTLWVMYNHADNIIHEISISAPKENPDILYHLFFDDDKMIFPANGKHFLYNGRRHTCYYKKGDTFIQFG